MAQRLLTVCVALSGRRIGAFANPGLTPWAVGRRPFGTQTGFAVWCTFCRGNGMPKRDVRFIGRLDSRLRGNDRAAKVLLKTLNRPAVIPAQEPVGLSDLSDRCVRHLKRRRRALYQPGPTAQDQIAVLI